MGDLLAGEETNNRAAEEFSNYISVDMLKENGLSFFIGSAVNGMVVAIISYFLVSFGLRLYHQRKAKRRTQSA